MKNKRMNPRVKALWIEALLSRKYKQGKGKLRRPSGEFCCLGVLCNLHAIEHPEFAAKQTDPTRYDDCLTYLPDVVSLWAGLETDRGSYVDQEGRGQHLSCDNDSGNMRFVAIADVIERTF